MVGGGLHPAQMSRVEGPPQCTPLIASISRLPEYILALR